MNDLQLWADVMDMSFQESMDGHIFIGDVFGVQEFETVDEATRWLLPKFLQFQAE